jgi:hypothetical protein
MICGEISKILLEERLNKQNNEVLCREARKEEMQENSYAVEVLVNGRAVKEHSHEGRTFIEARKGTEYSLRLRNSSYERVLMIPTVDGINVLTGNPYEDGDPGYIVLAQSAMTVDGFRKDLDSVGRFKFCSKKNSYCEEAGAPGNSGVIGVMVVSEKRKTWTSSQLIYTKPRPWVDEFKITWNDTDDSSGPRIRQAPVVYSHFVDDGKPLGYVPPNSGPISVNCCASELDTGTTWGAKKISRVTEESFDADGPVASMELFYASKKALKKMGVDLDGKQSIGFPSAFGKFAKPPKGWRG